VLEANTNSALVSENVYIAARNQYWNQNTARMQRWQRVRRYYRQRLIEIYRFLVPEGMRVLELGCGEGDLLAALRPSQGVGIDFSSALINAAKARHPPPLRFIEMNAQSLKLDGTFDYIICSDLVNELWDVQTVFASLKPLCHPQTRFLLNLHSNLWQAPRRLASKIGVARPQMMQNWLAPEDITNLLYLADFEVIRSSSEILWPVRTPLWDSLCNRVLVKLWPFRFFGLTNLVIARPIQKKPLPKPLVSVVVPARGEAGNIPAIFDRVPDMGRGTELIFVEGGSADDTYGAIEREMNLRKRPMTKLLRQTGKGKGDAVRLGFANATGELLMILDADLTVAPEDLPRFYEAWLSGKGDLINGVRMVYPMEERAMRFLNLVGNKFFSLAFSFLLGQKVKDTACGTKVLSKTHYEPILRNRAYFGDFDRFGDWDLLFGAAKFNLRIVDLPIRYRDRVYGETKMQRWRIGLLLLRMVILGLRRLKFV
jgi:ubiquinone/menaquinone biosynthesis C-methylase UbiE